MPLLVSILQGWSHICEIGKSGFCETLLTQCNSCARRLVLSAKLFFLSPLSFYSSRFLSNRVFHLIAFSSHRASHRIFFAACTEDVSNASLQWARVVHLKNFCGYACSKQSKAIKEGLVKESLLKEGLLKEGLLKEESVLFRA